jgi:hypothetical protein
VLQGNLAALRIRGARQIQAVRRVLLRRRDLQIRPFRCVWDVWGVGHPRKSRGECLVRQGSAVLDLLVRSQACDRRSVFRAAIRFPSREQMAQQWMPYKPVEAPFAASPCAAEPAR